MFQTLETMVAAPEVEFTPRKKKLMKKLEKKTILSDNRKKKIAVLKESC